MSKRKEKEAEYMTGRKAERKKTGRIGIAWILAVAICCMTPIYSYAEDHSSTEQKMKDANAALDQIQKSKNQANEKINELDEKKTKLNRKMSELDAKLGQLSNEIETTTQKLTQKEKEIKKTKKELKAAKKKAKKQYKDMKQRIRYIYENGTDSYLEALVSAQSFGDMLNKTEYVNALNEYDRAMLTDYKKTVNKIETDEKSLISQKKEIEQMKKDLDAQKEEVQKIVGETQKTIEKNNTELANAQDMVQQLEKQFKKQKEYEAQLERQKAEEDAKRLEEIKRKEQEAAQKRAEEEKARKAKENAASVEGSKQSAQPVVAATASDVEMLAALLQCEAGGESYDGKLAVGSVVMNRVASPSFPNTLAGVIYQAGQFSPVASGRFAAVLATGGASGECRSAAQEVLGGNITNGFLYFRSASSGMGGTRIGNNIFY